MIIAGGIALRLYLGLSGHIIVLGVDTGHVEDDIRVHDVVRAVLNPYWEGVPYFIVFVCNNRFTISVVECPVDIITRLARIWTFRIITELYCVYFPPTESVIAALVVANVDKTVKCLSVYWVERHRYGVAFTFYLGSWILTVVPREIRSTNASLEMSRG